MTETKPVLLREYQHECIEAITNARRMGQGMMTVALPPGTGKTTIFSAYLALHGGRALVVAHRHELLSQAKDTMMRVLPPGMRGGVTILGTNPISTAYSGQIVIASVQSLLNPDTRAKLGTFNTVIIDEAHHYTSAAWQTIILSWPTATVICFTGTPLRGDGIWAPEQIGEVVFSRTTRWAMEQGFLTDVYDMAQVEGDPTIDELADFTESAYEAHRGVVVAYCKNVCESDALATSLRLRGLQAASLNWETDPFTRDGVIRAARGGAIQILCNVALLTEGFDLPSINAIVINRPVRSRALMGQMVGRCMRPAPGKVSGYVYRLGVTADDTALVDGFLGTRRTWLRNATMSHRLSVGQAIEARKRMPFGKILGWWDSLSENNWRTGQD